MCTTGYIAAVNAQLFLDADFSACRCLKTLSEQDCLDKCGDASNPESYQESGYFSVVLLKNDIPKTFITFIITNL